MRPAGAAAGGAGGAVHPAAAAGDGDGGAVQPAAAAGDGAGGAVQPAAAAAGGRGRGRQRTAGGRGRGRGRVSGGGRGGGQRPAGRGDSRKRSLESDDSDDAEVEGAASTLTDLSKSGPRSQRPTRAAANTTAAMLKAAADEAGAGDVEGVNPRQCGAVRCCSCRCGVVCCDRPTCACACFVHAMMACCW